MALFDAYGRPVETEILREEQAAPTLTGIRNIYSIIDTSVGLTPERIISYLREAEYGDPWYYLELAERMEEKDLLYQGVLHTRKMAVSQLAASIVPADGSRQAQGDADFITDVLLRSGLSLSDALFDILDSLGKGFSATEIIWDTAGRDLRNGNTVWIPQRLAWRDPRWFMFDWISGEQLLVRTLRTEGQNPTDGRLTTFTPRIEGSEEGKETLAHQIGIQPATAPLIPFKFIVHVSKTKAGLPIRGGLARLAVWAYVFKNYVLKDWVTFAEIFGQPMRVGKYGTGATDNDKNALLRAVSNIGTDCAAIIPESMLIEFIENKQVTGSADLYEKLCNYLDKQMTIAVLGQELTTALPRGAGSRAAAEVHDVVRRDIATDDARKLCKTIQRDLIKPLIDLNRGPRSMYPSLKLDFEKSEDQVAISQALSAYVDRGMPVAVADIQERFGLRQPDPGEAILHPAVRINESVQGNPPTDDTVEASSRFLGTRTASSGREYRDRIDTFVAKLREQSDPAMAAIVKPLLVAMQKTRSYAELRKCIADAVGEANFGPFVEQLARAGFNVNLGGRLGIPPK
jgi:phage gp29-like protein